MESGFEISSFFSNPQSAIRNPQSKMSAKLTIIFFILICFEIGALLIILPWVQRPSWSENYLLVMAADHLHWPSLAMAMKRSDMRRAVTGLGVVNMVIGLRDAANLTRTTRAF